MGHIRFFFRLKVTFKQKCNFSCHHFLTLLSFQKFIFETKIKFCPSTESPQSLMVCSHQTQMYLFARVDYKQSQCKDVKRDEFALGDVNDSKCTTRLPRTCDIQLEQKISMTRSHASQSAKSLLTSS